MKQNWRLHSLETSVRNLALTVILLLALSTSVSAQFSYTTNNGTITLTGYTGPGGAVTIPEMIDGLPVTSIADRAFLGATNLTSVVIPNSVLAIGDFAFLGCTNLTNALIGSGVFKIGRWPFYNSPNAVTVDALNPYYYSGTDGALFNRNQTTLAQGPTDKTGSYVIPETVTTIDDAAFSGNNNLTNLTIPKNFTNTIYYVLESCRSLTSITVEALNPVYRSVDGVLFNSNQTELILYPRNKAGNYVVPDGVVSIGSSAFQACSSLTGITIPDSVTSIGGGAFFRCSSLTNIMIGSGVTNFGLYMALYGCTNLDTLTIAALNPAYRSSGNAVLNQDQTRLLLCFNGNTESFTVPDQVTDIAETALLACTSLTNLALPNSVTNIESRAFANCRNLRNITVAADNPAYSDLNGILFDKNRTTLIFRPGGIVGEYIIPPSVTNIDAEAFAFGTGLTNIAVSSNLVSLDASQFYNCWNLQAITIDEHNPEYSSWDGVLFNKDRTTLLAYPKGKAGSYSVPDGVVRLENNAFYNCTNLTSLNIPGSVTQIGYSVNNCPSLTNVTLGSGVADFEAGFAFLSCPQLNSIVVDPLNPNYSSKDGAIFNHDQTALILCPGGKAGTFMIPGNVTSIDPNAFANCPGLEAITVDALNPVYSSPDGVLFNRSQSRLIFCPAGRTGNYSVPDTVTSIGDYAFSDCAKLIGVTMGNSVTNLGEGAFQFCTSLTRITIGSRIANLGSYAFDGCFNLTEVSFRGNNHGYDLSAANPNAIAYYLPGTTGWETADLGIQKMLWNPQVQTDDSSFDPSQFGFNLIGNSNLVVVVEAATNLMAPVWAPVQVCVLKDGSAQFNDPQGKIVPHRYYRLRSP